MSPLQKHFQIDPYTPTDIEFPATGTTQNLGLMLDREGSSCQLVGGGFTITAGGFEVAAGNGLIRAANSLDSPRRYVAWAAHEFLLAELTDDSANHVYLEWNGGAPRLVVDPAGRYDADPNTNIWLGEVWREGATIYLHENRGIRAAMGAGNNRHRLIETRNQEYVLGEHPRVFTSLFPKIAVAANAFWYGGIRRDLPTKDTNAGGKFDYYFLDNTGAWNEIQDQTDIDLVHFDDGTAAPGAPAPAGHLAGGHFGVHWIFQGTDGSLHILFGRADYPLLTDALAAAVPGDQPEIFMWHATLVGQVIVQEGAVAFAAIRQSTDTAFATGAATAHNATTSKQGGAPGEYYHLTAAQVAALHTQGTDQGLDNGGPNASTAAQILAARLASHTQGTDQGLDTGGLNASTAAQVRTHRLGDGLDHSAVGVASANAAAAVVTANAASAAAAAASAAAAAAQATANAAASGVSALQDHLTAQEQQPSGTSGGTFTSGAWQIRAINTTTSSAGASVARVGSTLVLQPGTYEIDVWAMAFRTNSHQVRVWDVTGGATLMAGGSAYSNASTSAQGATHSRARRFITVAVPTTIRLEHRCQTTRAADGLGLAVNFGEPEVYAGINVTRIA